MASTNLFRLSKDTKKMELSPIIREQRQESPLEKKMTMKEWAQQNKDKVANVNLKLLESPDKNNRDIVKT